MFGAFTRFIQKRWAKGEADLEAWREQLAAGQEPESPRDVPA
jgi:hypothetical protein